MKEVERVIGFCPWVCIELSLCPSETDKEKLLLYEYILAKMNVESPRKIFLGTENVHLREAENAFFFFVTAMLLK